MRYSTLTLALAGVLMTSGCSSLVSLYPFATGAEAPFDRSLPGVWSNQKADSTYAIWQEGDHYRIAYVGNSDAVQFEARLLRVGDASILDVVQKGDEGFMLPVHAALRVWPGSATLRMAFLDTDWLKDRAKTELVAQTVDERTVITRPGDAVRAFLVKYGVNDSAHGEPETLHRVQ